MRQQTLPRRIRGW